MSKSVLEMVKNYLKEHGYDGLCNDDCGCDVNDLAPCDDIGDCKAARKDSNGNFYEVEQHAD
jgi:hypothetical protein